ncbi:DUF6090 family protein [Marixanthomonas ophiurae]|uniref:Uncharacterized protein n=1 Tax=Marixanthomonas ophiurae TaxID=387659 RepID=A0A3E1QD56_9FLAO|nr:DUF6090 family protein [Marixanthomonas ophiurae]RFN60078.1 hypothetical protein DZ858_08530 [Marixanthomonas ophiurae]
MIKLFRNIRKNMLKEGKTSRYLKYAIGEIILVVIGILIALSINNWNQERVNRAQSNELLRGIVKDLDQDIAGLNRSIDFTVSRLDFLERHMRKSDFSTTATDTLFKLFDGTARPFTMTVLSYEKAKNLGISELCSNDSLAFRINKYYTHTLDWSTLLYKVQYDEMTSLNAYWVKELEGLEFEFNISFPIPYLQDSVERRNNAIAGIMSPRGRNHIRLECNSHEIVIKNHRKYLEIAQGLRRNIKGYLAQ